MTYDSVFLRLAVAAALTLAVTACGGGGDDAEAAPATVPASTPASASGFNGTAYMETNSTIHYDGKDYGSSRFVVQGLIDQCNGFRKNYYGLPPIETSEATMASLDVFVNEKYFDTNKALTVITGNSADVPDLHRWVKDLSAPTASIPAVPPDCALSIAKHRDGTLWRDGVMYLLRYDAKKAIGYRKANTNTPVTLLDNDTFQNLPSGREVGKTCREVPGIANVAPDSHSCIWDLFPYVAYLNWPFALSGRVQFDPVRSQYETIEAVEAEAGKAIPPEIFEIPADFSVTISD